MSLRLSKAELAELLDRNPGLRVARSPLGAAERPPERPAGEIKPVPAAPAEAARSLSAQELHELLGCPSFKGKLEREEELSCWVAAELRRLGRAGKLRCSWTRVATEHRGGGAVGMLAQAKSIAMGSIPGCPDFAFLWGEGSGLIELKTVDPQSKIAFLDGEARSRRGTRSYLRPKQKLYRDWARGFGTRHAVARSVPEVLGILKGWGVLDG